MSDLQLKIRVLEAFGLQKADKLSGSDPFVVAKFRGLGKMMTSVQTSVIHNTSNPVWNQDITLCPKNVSDILLLKVYDHDTLSKDNLLGMIEIPLERFFQQGLQDQWLQLMKRKGSWKTLIGGHATWLNCPGQLHIQIWFGMGNQSTGLNPVQAPPQILNQTQYGGAQSTNFSKEAQTFSTGFHVVQPPSLSGNISSYGAQPSYGGVLQTQNITQTTYQTTTTGY